MQTYKELCPRWRSPRIPCICTFASLNTTSAATDAISIVIIQQSAVVRRELILNIVVLLSLKLKLLPFVPTLISRFNCAEFEVAVFIGILSRSAPCSPRFLPMWCSADELFAITISANAAINEEANHYNDGDQQNNYDDP